MKLRSKPLTLKISYLLRSLNQGKMLWKFESSRKYILFLLTRQGSKKHDHFFRIWYSSIILLLSSKDFGFGKKRSSNSYFFVFHVWCQRNLFRLTIMAQKLCTLLRRYEILHSPDPGPTIASLCSWDSNFLHLCRGLGTGGVYKVQSVFMGWAGREIYCFDHSCLSLIALPAGWWGLNL